MTNRNNKRLFYVVQFIELPFEGIDDYVCVPYSWLIKQRSSDRKVAVTYPNNEDPFDTRDRVKNEERPNDDWRLYMALIKYESEDYKDAEFWIATRNDYGPGEEESGIRDLQKVFVLDTQPEPELNRKLRSAGQPFWSGLSLNKPQLTVKPNKSPRKPLPRISIRRPLSQSLDKNFDNKRLKLDENAKSGIVTDHVTIESGRSKQERSKIITENQLIQNDQTKTSFASNGEMNTEQSTQPGVIMENQSVVTSVQSSSKKILAEQQPLSKLTVEQQLSPEFPARQQSSPVGLSFQQPISISVVDRDKSNEDLKSCQNVPAEPVTEERTSAVTPPNTLEQTPQPEPINERSIPPDRHDHSLSVSYQRDVSVRQPKEPDNTQKSHLNQILTALNIVPRPPITANQPIQQYAHPQLPIFPVSCASYSKPEPQKMNESNYIKVVYNHQKPHSQDFMFDNKPSTYHHESNCEKLSQLRVNSAKKQSVAKNLKNPVDKKTRLEGITKNITTMQYPPNSMMRFSSPTGSSVRQTAPLAQNHLQQAPVNSSLVNNVRCSIREKGIDPRVQFSKGIMNTPAAQNLSKLAHQYQSFVEASREQQCLPAQEDYLQQFARINDMLARQTTAQTIHPGVYHQNAMMNRGFVMQSQPNLTNQPIQFLPRNENQNIPANSAYVHDVIRHELMRRSIDGAHTTYKPNVKNGENIQSNAYNSSNQSYQNSEHLQQGQYLRNYQDPCTASAHNGFPLQSNCSFQNFRPQRVTKNPRSLSTLKTPSQALFDAQKSCLLQELNIQRIENQNFTENSNANLAALPDKITVEPVRTMQDFGVQTMLPSDRPYETQSTVAQSNHVYQYPHPQKTMVNQATETDSIMDVGHCADEIARSPVGETTSNAEGSTYQTDESMSAEQGSLYQETASDSESATEHEIESENEIGTEANQPTLTTVQNSTPENQQKQSRIDVEQDMLSLFGTLFTQMGANLSYTSDMFNHLRNSILVCAKTYEKLLEQVDKFNLIESLQTPKSSPNNVTSPVQQMTQGKSAGDDIKIGVGSAPAPIREQRGTFSLPAEYDPNDSKWTLKYREYKPGLVELLPRTGVYVSKKELKRCIQKSTDCRTLTRLLLTEVFSENALSVCSLTGGRAKAFNSVNIDVRPGLDDHARMVLLTFVEEHGNKYGWITSDTPAVMSSIRTKINEIRAKHGQTCEV
uniref:BEN domain-containing protein n=1 Tax=Glyptapanteles indiensis TaxID=92994 RepID=B7S958_GLYIN|nr:conserved hypothetical protein [Glyptapanteles indiensis]